MGASARAIRAAFGAVVLALALVLAIGAMFASMPLRALAVNGGSPDKQSLSVRGADTLQVGGDAFECATVSGLGASTLYADVSVDGAVATRDMEYRFDDAEDTFGVVQLNSKASYVASHSGSISLDFFDAKTSERDGASPLLSANVYAVCMQVDGQMVGSVEDSMIGIRTASADRAQDAIEVPTQIVRGSDVYCLVGSGKVRPSLKDGVLCVAYSKVDSEHSVSASVVYVDAQGNELKRESYSVEQGSVKSVDIAASFDANGKVYTPASAMKSVILSASEPEHRIYCIARAESDTATRDIAISYVSTDGSALMTDRVSVGAGGYLYAPATAFSQANDGSVMRYVLMGAIDSDGRAYTADEAKSLSLSRDGASTYELRYRAEGNELTYTVNFALVRNAGNGNTSISVARQETAKVSAGQDASISLPETIEQAGASYKRFGSDDSLSYTWNDVQNGRALVDTVYYVASDVATPEAYTVNVRYVDAVSGAQIGGETMTCSPDDGALSVTSPVSVDADGVAYERLSGQESAILHRFYDPYRTYTIYYAQPDAMTQGDTVVNRTVVIDGGVRYYTIAADGTVSASDNSNAGGLVAAVPYATVASAASGGASASGGSSDTAADGGNAIAPSGESAYSERLGDDQTPLSSADQEQQAGQPDIGLVASVAAVAACVVAVAVAVALKKRRSSNDAKEA